MNHYKVLTNKYRPKILKNIVGQQHIVRLIKNTVKLKKIHHAYLLTGIRGIGKTTLARIMATIFNCISENTVKLLEPCLKCTSCTMINNDKSYDIYEIDGASHTGIANIKQIIENTQYKPININYKIFIIDEVHMLSNSACNGLLKILESPPQHVKFIFATTEGYKLLPTIISRCQQLKLQPITSTEIEKHLEYICKNENIHITKDSIMTVAKAATGSIRDALSILEQITLVKKDTEITYDHTCEMLGMVKETNVIQIFDAIVSGNTMKSLELIRNLYNRGVILKNLIEELCNVIHNISLLKINYSFSKNYKDIYIKYTKLSMIELNRMWQMTSDIYHQINNTYNELTYLEMQIIKIIHTNFKISLEEIININTDKQNKHPKSYEELLTLILEKEEITLYNILNKKSQIIFFSEDQIILNDTNQTQINYIKNRLQKITGKLWKIEAKEKTQCNNSIQEINEIKKNPLITETLKRFPQLTINNIQRKN